MASLCRRVGLILSTCIVGLVSLVLADEEFKTPHQWLDKQDSIWHRFVTRPDLQAPKFDIKVYDEKALSPGYWFVSPYEDANYQGRGQPWEGPYIYDGHGDVIWAGTPLFDHFKFWDFKVADFDGTDMLTGIAQRDNAGIVLNNNYEVVRNFSWTPAWATSNMHEFNVVGHGSRVLVATKEEHMKLSTELSKTVGYFGRCEITADGIKELDITVDPPRTIFEWRGIDHMPLKESIMRPQEIERLCTHNLDINHINSIDKFPDGDYLLSMRHTSTIYKISHTDGSIVWRLGGFQSDYVLPVEAQFSRQHNARYIEQNATHTVISLLDNAFGWLDNPTHSHSRGLIIALNNHKKTVELLHHADHPNNTLSESRGSNQALPSGNLFVCWADRARISEHSPDGKLLMHSFLKSKVDSYRAYKFPWVGHPKQPPNVYSAAFVTRKDTVTTMVYVSWNGATEVASWILYESDANGKNLNRLKEAARRGFETNINYDGFAEYVVLEALDKHDESIGRSRVIQTIAPVEEASELEKSWVFSILANPVSAFVAGFVACAVVCIIIWLAVRSKGRYWWRPKYEPAETEEREVLFGEGAEGDDDEGVELKDRAYT